MLALGQSSRPQQTYLLQLGLGLRHIDGCVLCDRPVEIERLAKVGVELEWKLEMSALHLASGRFRDPWRGKHASEPVSTGALNLAFTSAFSDTFT